MTFDFLAERLAALIQLNTDLARITRDFGQGWQIESIPPGTDWAAIDRNTSDGYIRVIPARNLRALRWRLAQAELNHPADLWLPPTSAAPAAGTRTPAGHGPGSGRHAQVVIVRP